MMLSMQSQASVESGENKLICPHYEKRHYVLQLLPSAEAPQSDVGNQK